MQRQRLPLIDFSVEAQEGFLYRRLDCSLGTTVRCAKRNPTKIKDSPGFVAALDHNEGSTPMAIATDGIKESYYLLARTEVVDRIDSKVLNDCSLLRFSAKRSTSFN